MAQIISNVDFGFHNRDLQAANAAIQAVQITPTLGLAHWEKPDETTRAIDGFWQSLAAVNVAQT